ncbi:hypothetical protein Dimus_006851 [Dionaea muscipula]
MPLLLAVKQFHEILFAARHCIAPGNISFSLRSLPPNLLHSPSTLAPITLQSPHLIFFSDCDCRRGSYQFIDSLDNFSIANAYNQDYQAYLENHASHLHVATLKCLPHSGIEDILLHKRRRSFDKIFAELQLSYFYQFSHTHPQRSTGMPYAITRIATVIFCRPVNPGTPRASFF